MGGRHDPLDAEGLDPLVSGVDVADEEVENGFGPPRVATPGLGALTSKGRGRNSKSDVGRAEALTK
jgi:hypothetical protein